MNHAVSTAVLAALLVFGAGAGVGFVVGVRESPSYYDAMKMEYRLREVFCEQAVRNSLMKTCEVIR